MSSISSWKPFLTPVLRLPLLGGPPDPGPYSYLRHLLYSCPSIPINWKLPEGTDFVLTSLHLWTWHNAHMKQTHDSCQLNEEEASKLFLKNNVPTWGYSCAVPQVEAG